MRLLFFFFSFVFFWSEFPQSILDFGHLGGAAISTGLQFRPSYNISTVVTLRCGVLSIRWRGIQSTVLEWTTVQVTCVKRDIAAGRRAAAPTTMNSGVSQLTASSLLCYWGKGSDLMAVYRSLLRPAGKHSRCPIMLTCSSKVLGPYP